MILHRTQRLPGKIAAVMAGTILVFALTLGASVLWISRALDGQADEDSRRLVTSALATLTSEMLALTVEYGRWDDFAAAVQRRDMDWLYRNVGVTTATALTTDHVVIWGGGLDRDLGWLDQSPPAGLSRLVRTPVLLQADRRLAAEVPIGSPGGPRFFVWRGNDLFAAGASRVEWTLEASRAEADEARIPRILIGRRITQAEVDATASKTLLAGLRIDRVAPKGRPAVPLDGAEGTPVAWLSWDPPSPGSALLGRICRSWCRSPPWRWRWGFWA